MRRKHFVVFVALLVFAIVVASCAGGATPAPTKAPESQPAQTEPETKAKSPLEELVEKAKAEGGVINTYGMPETWANYGEIYGVFEQKYGIRQQDIDMGSSVVLARMREEKASKNDVADLKPSFAAMLANEGLTLDYKVSCWDKWPEGQKGEGKDGSVWYAAYKGTLGWIVNTSMVDKVPRSWKELNDERYKGLVSYLDPRATGTGINTVEAAAYAVSGDPYNYEAGAKFLAELHQKGIIASVDPKVDISKFQRGEVAILINFDYNLLKWKEDLGIPAEVVIPEDGTVSSGGGVVAARNAPHPNTAKLFLEYLLCGEGQQLYAKAFVSPMNPDVELPPDVAAKFPPKEAYKSAVFIDYKKDAEISDALKAAWAEAVGAPAPAEEKESKAPSLDELVKKAKAEGGVINTYGMPETWANYGEIYGVFEQKYGIRQQDIDMGSSVVLARMREEKASKNDVADLKPSFAAMLANEGLTLDYKVSCWDKWPEGQKGEGKDGSVWYAAYKGTLGWIVNTSMVDKVPRSWKELNDERYKGLVSYLDPRATGTGINTVEAAAYAVSGDPYNYEAGAKFLAELHQKGIIASVDPKVDISKFQRGEVAILINFDYNLLKWKEDLGIPAEVVIPEDGTVSSGGGVVAARNAPHPNTAKLFLEYLLCGEGQQLYAKAFVSPMNPDVELPPDVAAKFPPKEAYKSAVFIDYKKDAEISDALKAAWAEAVGAK